MSHTLDEAIHSAVENTWTERRRSAGEPSEAWQPRGLSGAHGSSLAAALVASLEASALPACQDVDELFRCAFDLARVSIGLERVAFYRREPSPGRVLLRGTWGVGADGQTTDERHLTHALSSEDELSLANLRHIGACALYRPRACRTAIDADRVQLLGEGWVMVTPLIHGNDLVGVVYNDAAISGSAVDASQQAAVAVLASWVGIQYAARRWAPWEPLRSRSEQSELVASVRQAVNQDLSRLGKELALQFGVSAGHLARIFKREMGVSLVEYRNRQRIARFSETLLQSGRSRCLKQVAAEAGFGSYSQFNRIQKKFGHEGGRRPAAFDAHVPASLAHAPHTPAPWPPLR
jgi:AraC-like DNA-binding protein